jgi:hypothetical protein
MKGSLGDETNAAYIYNVSEKLTVFQKLLCTLLIMTVKAYIRSTIEYKQELLHFLHSIFKEGK